MATDEGSCPKLTLDKVEKRGNIEGLLRMWFEQGHCNLLAMIWASLLLNPVGY